MKEAVKSIPPSDSFLTVGLPLKISLTLDRQKIVSGSTLLGWKESAWLVCEWTSQLGHSIGLTAGTPCTVSYLLDGKLVGYRTEIRGVIATPVPLLFIAFPRAVEEMQLRKHARVSSSEPAFLTRVGPRSQEASSINPSDQTGGMVRDLSPGGCRIALTKTPSWLRTGSAFHLEFELPGLGHITSLHCVVKNVKKGEGGDIIGVEFNFGKLEYIEYRGWGGSVRNAVEQWTLQKSGGPTSL